MANFKEMALDIACPVCKGHSYYTCEVDGEFLTTVFWCSTNRKTNNPCNGRVAYCKKCEKYYPEKGFGFQNGTYECKECGFVQWELTERKEAENKQENELLASIRNIMGKI